MRANKETIVRYAPWAAALAILIAGAIAATGVPDAAPLSLPAGLRPVLFAPGDSARPTPRTIRPNLLVVEQNSPIVAPDGRLAQALGIVTTTDVFTPILGKGEAQPATRVLTIGKASAGPTEIELHLMRGESPRAAENHSLGTFRITGLEPNAQGRAQATLIFRVSDGVIVVAAIDPVSKRNLPAELVRPGPGR